MCWKTFEKKSAEVKTAERDIPVFKVVNIAGEEEYKETKNIGRAYPYYRYDRGLYYECKADKFSLEGGGKTYAYEPGKEYSASGFAQSCTVVFGQSFGVYFRTDGYVYCRSEGFHSYSPQCTLVKNGAWYAVVYDGAVNERYAQDGYAAWTGQIVPGVMDCVIPKGARYCVNEQGEYVSDRLRVKGFRTVDEATRK